MPNTLNNALNELRELLPAERLRGLAGKNAAPKEIPGVNAHIHLPPNFSAFETVGEAVDLAVLQGVGVLGANNYYDFRAYREFAQRALAARIFPLFGVEVIALHDEWKRFDVKVNDPGNPGKIYFCGKGIAHFETLSVEATRILEKIRRNDIARMEAMIERLNEIGAERDVPVDVPVESIVRRVCQRHKAPREAVILQERHICQAFQERLFEAVPEEKRALALDRLFAAPLKVDAFDPMTVQKEIRSRLMKAGQPAYVEETFVPLDEARQLVLELGGIPCYPVLADGVSPISPFESPVEDLIENLRKLDVSCVEFIPTRNTSELLEVYVPALRDAGFVVSTGTEHNTLGKQTLIPHCAEGEPLPERVREIFWEGACVIAGHQSMRMQGEPGFVTAEGVLNPSYPGSEDRIAAYRRLGAAAIKLAIEPD